MVTTAPATAGVSTAPATHQAGAPPSALMAATGLGLSCGGRTIWSGADCGVAPGQRTEHVITTETLSSQYDAPVEVVRHRRGRVFVAGLDDEAAHSHDLDSSSSRPEGFRQC